VTQASKAHGVRSLGYLTQKDVGPLSLPLDDDPDRFRGQAHA
jgi:hypothetical protein